MNIPLANEDNLFLNNIESCTQQASVTTKHNLVLAGAELGATQFQLLVFICHFLNAFLIVSKVSALKMSFGSCFAIWNSIFDVKTFYLTKGESKNALEGFEIKTRFLIVYPSIENNALISLCKTPNSGENP